MWFKGLLSIALLVSTFLSVTVWATDDEAAIDKAQINYIAASEEMLGIKDGYTLNVERVAEDATLFLESEFSKTLPKFLQVEANLIGYRIPGVRLAVTRFVRRHFVGTTIKDGFFPDVKKILQLDQDTLSKVIMGSFDGPRKSQGWSDADFAHMGYFMISPMGKMLARLAYNSENDPDAEVRKESKEAWNIIHPILKAAAAEDIGSYRSGNEYRIKEIGKRLAERWGSEVFKVLSEWDRQHAKLKDAVQARVLDSQPVVDVDLELTRNSFLRLAQTVRDLDGIPPLPSCEEVLAQKRMLQ